MKTIYIDADGCAVKDEVYKVARRYRWRVFVVANQPINTPSIPGIFSIMVGKGADVADDYIVERCGRGDIVITDTTWNEAYCRARPAPSYTPSHSRLDVISSVATRMAAA